MKKVMSNSVTENHEKFMVRLPIGLREQLRGLAEQNRRSMNSEIIRAVERAVREEGQDGK